MAVVIAGKRKLTYAEYALIPADGNRHEIIVGVHYVSPTPLVDHQRIAAELNDVLCALFVRTGRGRVLFAPCSSWSCTGAPAWANTGSSIPTSGA